MLFRRRKPATIGERIRTYLWPRRSFSRSIQYFAKRVLRLTASSHAIAAGVAAGVFASFSPFLGFHFIMAVVLAYLLAGNLVAAVVGTGVGNPLTFPFIWAGSYELGTFIVNRGAMDERHINFAKMFRHFHFIELWKPILEPMAVGGTILGLGAGLIFYGITYWGVTVFRERRRIRMAERARARTERSYSGHQTI